MRDDAAGGRRVRAARRTATASAGSRSAGGLLRGAVGEFQGKSELTRRYEIESMQCDANATVST